MSQTFLLGGILGAGGVLGDQEIVGSESASPFLLGGVMGFGGVMGEATFAAGDVVESSSAAVFGLATQSGWEFRHLAAAAASLPLTGASEALMVFRLSEVLGMTSAWQTAQLTRLFETLQTNGDLDTQAFVNRAPQAGFTLAEQVQLTWLLQAAEALGLGGEGLPRGHRFTALEDPLQLSHTAATQLLAHNLIALKAAFDDKAQRFFERMAEETAGWAAELSSLLRGLSAAAEQLELGAVMEDSAVITALPRSQWALTDSPLLNGLFGAAAEDSFTLVTLGLKLDGELYTGWVLNTENTGVTQYQDYPFNSLARFGDRYLGAGEMGIGELAGNTDAGDPIQAYLKTGVTDFETSHRKRMHRSYLGITAEGQVVLKVTTDTGTEDWYRLTPKSGPVHTERVKLGKGVKSRYWQFEVSNVDGADFELESLELAPIVLSGRL